MKRGFEKKGILVKTAVLAASIFIAMFMLAGCGKSQEKKLKVVTTVYPAYDWTKQVLGDKAKDAEVIYLLDNGVDMHSYQPSSKDIAKISDCDVFIYSGGESETWASKALKEAKNKNMKVVNMMSLVDTSLISEDDESGIQDPGEEEDHEPGETCDCGGKDDKCDCKDCACDNCKKNEKENDKDSGVKIYEEYDEHVWMSLRNAQKITTGIYEALAAADKDNAATYKKNAESYNKKLADLDKKYADAANASKDKFMVVPDRFPMAYLLKDYNIDYLAAFRGCSAESEASFSTVAALARKADELNKKYLLVTETSDKKLAKAVSENTASKDKKIVVFDVMHSVNKKDIKDGKEYLKVMQKNLDAFTKAIG